MLMILLSTPFGMWGADQNWYLVHMSGIGFQGQFLTWLVPTHLENTKGRAFQAQDTYFFDYFRKFALEIFQFDG